MEEDLKNLESRVDELIQLYNRLRAENDNLKSGRESIEHQHDKLAERTRLARDRLEAIVERLRTLDTG